MVLTMAERGIVEDIAVPRDRIPDFVRATQEIAVSLHMDPTTGMMLSLAGHAGDGNMHPTILFFTDVTEEKEAKAKQAIEQIVKRGLEMGGTISGEHGIGIHKAEFLELELGRPQIDIMKRIKNAIDPKHIMNPGKIWLNGGVA